ncbi:hypothetical protein HNQ96_005050 [Aminobacter lissarensis]|uniref:Uncharacterized protein n=1 Tax=Aminobacter carboxidus TaxID=376165 RepID=A0A8E2BDY2_9HYPH|nr:hypothetical protein [Aminobacter lissarensis]
MLESALHKKIVTVLGEIRAAETSLSLFAALETGCTASDSMRSCGQVIDC